MSKLVSALVGFISGAALGSGITYMVLSDKLDKRFDKEIADIKEYYRLRSESSNDSEEEKAEETVEEKKTDIPVNSEDPILKTAVDTNKVDYTKYSRPIVNDIIEDDDTSKDLFDNYDPYSPVIISSEDYEELKTNQIKYGYEIMELTYVEEDDILLDEEDEPISVTMVGYKAIRELTEIDSNHAIVYVRNDSLKIAYEISMSL